MISIEADYQKALETKDEKFKARLVRFEKHTQELYKSPSGQEWLQMLALLCGHPNFHAPVADPVYAAHQHGRCEVIAFILRRGSEEVIPTIPTPKPPNTNGKHNQRREGAPRRPRRTGQSS